MSPKTLYEKIWDSHVVHESHDGKPALIYIDRHLIHEGTSPQAFAGLKAEGRTVRRPDLTFAVMDHSVPTVSKERLLPIVDTDARLQFEALEKNCREHGVRLFDMNSANQGIVHIIGPELGDYAAGADDCLRGQSYVDAWRVWDFGVWDWDKRSGACAGHAMPDAIALEDHAHCGEWEAASRRYGERYRFGDHREDRDQRRQRACGGV